MLFCGCTDEGCLRGESGAPMLLPFAAPKDGEPSHILSDAGGGSFSVGTLDPSTLKFAPLRSAGTNGSFATAGGSAGRCGRAR